MYNKENYWCINGYAFSNVVRDVCIKGNPGNQYAEMDEDGVRPIVTLKSDVLITDGDGSVDNPYIIKS